MQAKNPEAQTKENPAPDEREKRFAARYLDTGKEPGAWNMAVDEVLLAACRARLAEGSGGEEIPPVLRMYAWSPAALSLGRAQSAERDVRLDRLREKEVDLCRRLTGGRAVLHDREITYSFVGSEKFLGKSIGESYRRLSEGLAAGLRRLGAAAEIEPPGGNRYTSHPSCFATSSLCELSIRGRKVVGSAQCREGGAVLQHGSVLLRSPGGRFASFLRPRGAGGNGVILPPDHAAGLCEALGREVTFAEAAAAIRAGMAEALSLDFREAPLRPDERAAAANLVRARYGNDGWTFSRQRPGARFALLDTLRCDDLSFS